MGCKPNEIKAIAESYACRIWDKKDLTAIDELLDPNIVIHTLLGDFLGQKPMKQVVQAWLKAFPDLKVNNNDIISEGEVVMIHWNATGTHLGEFKGIQATHKPISYAGVTLYRIRNGKIFDYAAYLDMNHLLNQIN